MITGGCACGKVRFEVDGALADASFCHCVRCRRVTGSAFGAWGAALASDFRLVAGSECLSTWIQSDRVTRTFCSLCGSPVTARHCAEPEGVFVGLGTLDDDSVVRPEYHQYTDSCASWHRISDDLPRHRAWPSHHAGEID